MLNPIKWLFLLVMIVAGPTTGTAQERLTVFRLPPSVGATPIEIPGAGRQSATPIEIPGAGRYGATPIEIPGASKGNLVAVLPKPLPGPAAETLDPRTVRGQFSALPLPIPDPRAIEKMGRFVYAVLPDGTIYGDTNFGYSRFDSIETYQRFLGTH